MIRNVLTRRREYGTYLATARRHRRRIKIPLQLMKAAVPAESYVIHLSSASLFSYSGGGFTNFFLIKERTHKIINFNIPNDFIKKFPTTRT